MFLINPYIFATGAAFTGILDTYTGATVGYSLRWLNSAYTGALVRIRRSSDSAEKDFYPDTNNELSMSSEDGAGTSLSSWITTDSGYVVKWYDQSTAGGTGSGNDAYQTTVANQPRIINAGTLDTDPNNGNPAMYVDGSNDLLILGSSVALTQEFYEHMVFNRPTSAKISTGMANSAGAAATGFVWFTNDAIYSAVTTTTLHDATQTQTGDFIHTTLRDASNNVKMWRNGSADTTKVVSGTAATFNQIMRYGGGSYMTGYMQELIYWNSDQESNRTGIETDANNYWMYTYLLDDYPSSTVAYSVRLLKSDYTGALVRIRRSSDNAEKDFYPDHFNRLSMTSEDGGGTSLSSWITTDSGYIVKWYDQSGNNNYAQSVVAATQARIVNAGTLETDPNNGKVAIFCDGSNDAASLVSPINITQNYYQHLVFNRASSGIHSVSLAGTGVFTWIWFTNNGTYSGTTTTTIHDTTQTQTGDFIQTTLRDSSDNVKFWENGTAKTTKTNAGTTGSFNLLWLRAGTYHNGYMQELVYWNSDQEPNQSGIESDANTYFNVF